MARSHAGKLLLAFFALSCVATIFCSAKLCTDDGEKEALRRSLERESCLRGMEMVEPEETERAARLFHRDGFVVVKNALSANHTLGLKQACNTMTERIMTVDNLHLGNRGPFRWSLGTASQTGHLLHWKEFAQVVDNPRILPLLDAIFGNQRYICRGARGDVNLPGADWQGLHSDTWDDWIHDPSSFDKDKDGKLGGGRLGLADLPLFHVVVNYNVIDINKWNAPLRQIPMTQNSHRPIPSLENEPDWMRKSTLCPLPAGSAIVRDPRAWHGGTPNLSDAPRCMPNVEYYAYWFRYHDSQQMTKSMPADLYSELSSRGKELCAEILDAGSTSAEMREHELSEKLMLLYSEHEQCYRKLGLTDALKKEYQAKGFWIENISGVPKKTEEKETEEEREEL